MSDPAPTEEWPLAVAGRTGGGDMRPLRGRLEGGPAAADRGLPRRSARGGASGLLRELLVLELTYRRRNGERPTPEEYRRRFPERGWSVIETILGARRPSAGRPAPGRRGPQPALRPPRPADNFINRDALVAAFNAWVADKSAVAAARSCSSRGAVDAETHALLEALVAQAPPDARRRPRARAWPPSARSARSGDDLERLADPELQACLTRVPRTDDRADPDATAPHARAAGTSTAAGRGSASCGCTGPGAWARSSSPATRSCTARSPSRRSSDRHADDPDSRSRFLQSRPRSPAGWSIRGSSRSTAWAPTPTAGRFTPCGSSRGTASRTPSRASTRRTSRAATRASGRWRCASCSAGSSTSATRSPTRTAGACCTAT